MDVAFPGALPTIMAGVKISMGVSLIIIVSAESLAAKSGIGFLIWTSWQVFQVEKMYVGSWCRRCSVLDLRCC
jgi:NitT/TauT family transport system permease protein